MAAVELETLTTLQDFSLRGFVVRGYSVAVEIDFKPFEQPIIAGSNELAPHGIAPASLDAGEPNPVKVKNTFYSTLFFTRDFGFKAAWSGNQSEILAGDEIDFRFASDIVIGEEQPIFTGGFDALEIVAASIWNYRSDITPAGVFLQQWGKPTIYNLHTYVYSPAVLGMAIGVAKIENKHRPIFPIGHDSLVGGTPKIINRNRYVFAGGIYPNSKQVSANGMVSFWIRHLKPNGIDANKFGTAWISHHRRLVETRGSSTDLLGLAWVSFRVRGIDLDRNSIKPPDFYRPSIGGEQSIEPFGFDATEWGSRITPEPQAIYTHENDFSLFGETVVFNWLSMIEPIGTQSNQAEDLRFGRTWIFNWQQYVIQETDEQSELAPPELKGWTSIENRNRQIVHHSTNPPFFPGPLIYNNARLIEPMGFDSCRVADVMVSHWLRSIALEGIASGYLSDWHAVHNAGWIIAPYGKNLADIGEHRIENTRRYYRWIGAFDSVEYGLPMVDYAQRSVWIESRFSIEPPAIPLPEVFSTWQHLETQGDDMQGLGNHHLEIRFNKITPRWAHRNVFGVPKVHNVTPELGVFGQDMVESGKPIVWLYNCYIEPIGDGLMVFGRAMIRERTQYIVVQGTNMAQFGNKALVETDGTPLASQQTIYPQSFGNWTFSAMGNPVLNQAVIKPVGIRPPDVGLHEIVQNLIWVELGIATEFTGQPSISLLNRVISLGSKNDGGIFEEGYGTPAVSPHTIWCRHDTPNQARLNHLGSGWHDVDSYTFYKQKRLGEPHVRLAQNGYSPHVSAGSFLYLGFPDVSLKRRYIEPIGARPFRMGWVTVGDGTQFIEQFESDDSMAMGQHKVAFPEDERPNVLRPTGIGDSDIGRADVSLWIREINPQDWDSQALGYSRGLPNEYMPQSLHIGFPMPIVPQSEDMAVIGEAWVSWFHRPIYPVGFDPFMMEYDYWDFEKRLRVTKTDTGTFTPPIPLTRSIGGIGFDGFEQGVGNVGNRVQYIRPDGYADQFRKGAF